MRLLFTMVAPYLFALCASASASQAASLKEIRFGVTSADETRIVFDIEGRFDYGLSGDRTGDGRLVVALEGLKGRDGVAEGGPGKGHVETYARSGGAGGARSYVFDFRKTARIKDVFVLEPRGEVRHRRLVIDLAASDLDGFMASLPRPYDDLTEMIAASTGSSATQPAEPAEPVGRAAGEPAPREAEAGATTDRRRARRGRRARIVIDPGHGGGDPGAKGPKGTLEKSVTLSAGLKLAQILKDRGGYEVILTREDDTRLGVHERARLARKARPDLFISLHADAIADKSLRGGSIYTLSKEGKERSVEEALKKGDFLAADLRKDHEKEVGGILHALAHRETLNASTKFATILVGELEGEIALVNNSLRQKDLRVLLAPEVPAVLVELAFISNAKDEANLNSKAWRARASGAIADAIDAYFDEQIEARNRDFGEIPSAG